MQPSPRCRQRSGRNLVPEERRMNNAQRSTLRRGSSSGHAPLAELQRFQQRALVVGVVGLGVCVAGAFFSPAQFFRSYLLAYLFWLSVALGCLAIVMVHHLSGGAWGLVIRRLLESGTRTLPLMALLFLPLLLGAYKYGLYPWAVAEEVNRSEVLKHKAPYLNLPFFLARTAFYFAVWIGIS